MKYRRFGKTELQIPVISCGGMRFQSSWKSEDPVSDESQRNLERCVRRALEHGINHFETARGYGTSENQLGRILPTLPRHEIIVQTKVAPNADPARFTEVFETSMGFLRLDYVDLFAFHGVNTHESADNMMGCLETAQGWKREGRIRHLGFSTHGPLDVILRCIETDALDYINLHWYYIFQDNWPAVLEARKRDMGVFIISPNDKGGMLYNPSEKLRRLTAPLHPMAFNDLFCLSRPEVHTLSCGAARPEDFDIHVEAVEMLDRADELLPPILERLEAEMEGVLGREWVETWQEGLPEWDQTPGNVNIPAILRLRNLVLAFDMHEFARKRYNLLGNGGDWFPGENAAKVEELDLAPCLARSPHADRVPALLMETHERLAGEAVKRLQQSSREP